MEQHGVAVGEKFTDSDAPQALMDVRGKEVLAVVDGPAIMAQLSVNAIDVAQKMTDESIPDDIKTFLNDLISLA